MFVYAVNIIWVMCMIKTAQPANLLYLSQCSKLLLLIQLYSKDFFFKDNFFWMSNKLESIQKHISRSYIVGKVQNAKIVYKTIFSESNTQRECEKYIKVLGIK